MNDNDGEITVDPRIDDDVGVDADASLSERQKTERENMLFRGDDVEIAAKCTKRLTDVAPWVHSAEQFWKYSGDTGAWEPEDGEDIRALAMTYAGHPVFAGNNRAGDPQGKPLKMNSGKVDGVVRCVHTLLHQKDFFDKAPTGIAFSNGFVLIDKNGEIQKEKHSPDHRARFSLGFGYHEYGCESWRAFLRDLFRDDDDAVFKIQCLREFIGLCLVGRIVGFEKSLILFGSGSNGKSVLLSTVLDLFPVRARTSVPPQLWAEEYHLARLDGSAINVVSELPQREILESNSLKQVISGDQVTARRPRENPFDFCPRAGHIFASNPPLPQVNDFSPGFWRRWTLIEFNRAFTRDEAEVKEKLLAKLKAELPGITYWALDGAATALRAGKLCEIPSSTTALERWRRSSDQIASFLDEECKRDGADKFSVDEIYRGYRSWCSRSGHKTIGRTRFRERLEACGVKAESDGGRWFMHLELRTRPTSDGYGEDD